MRLSVIAVSTFMMPVFAGASDVPALRCTEQWQDAATQASYCYIMPPTDATAGIILGIDKDQTLNMLGGRHDFVDTTGKRRQLLAADSLYQPFVTRIALNDQRILEVYKYDSLDGMAAYVLIDARKTYRPFPNMPTHTLGQLADGDYVLANGKALRMEHGAAQFPDWKNDGIPDFILPPLEEPKEGAL